MSFCFSSFFQFWICDANVVIGSPHVLSFRVDSETASTSPHSHPRNMFTSCDRASRKRSCSTAWSLSECLSPVTLSGEPLHNFSPPASWSWELLEQTVPSVLSKKAFQITEEVQHFFFFVAWSAINLCPLSIPVTGINMIPLPRSLAWLMENIH